VPESVSIFTKLVFAIGLLVLLALHEIKNKTNANIKKDFHAKNV